MFFKVTVQLAAVMLTVDVTRMTAGTSRSWGVISKWSETVTYGCHAICCSRPTWLKLQLRDFPGWRGWRAGWLGPLLTTIVAAVVDWLLRPEIAQKQGKQVRNREPSTAIRKVIRSSTRSQWRLRRREGGHMVVLTARKYQPCSSIELWLKPVK